MFMHTFTRSLFNSFVGRSFDIIIRLEPEKSEVVILNSAAILFHGKSRQTVALHQILIIFGARTVSSQFSQKFIFAESVGVKEQCSL